MNASGMINISTASDLDNGSCKEPSVFFSPGKSSSLQSGSGSGFSFQNALIGQQDMSKFYRTSTTQKIFGMVSRLCEIGKLCNAMKIIMKILINI